MPAALIEIDMKHSGSYKLLSGISYPKDTGIIL